MKPRIDKGETSMMRRLLLLFAVVLAGSGIVCADEVVIKAGRVYTHTGPPLTPGAVHVKDGKIVAVAGSLTAPAGVKVLDLGGGCLLPGFVDALTNLGVEGGLAESTVEVTPRFRVADVFDGGTREVRRARGDGTTTAGVAPGTDNVIAGIGALVKTNGTLLRSDGALVMTLSSDPASGNSARSRPDSLYVRQPTNRMGVVWILRAEFMKAKSGQGPLREALDGKRPVICISRTDADLTSALRLKHEFPMNLTLAGGHEAYKVRSELAAAKVPVLLAQQSTSAGQGPESTETILNLPGTLHEAGVIFALTGGKLLDQARFAVRHGLPRGAALDAITRTPARLLGVGDRLGTIAPGRDADLVALSGEPFDLTTVVRWTMIDGAVRAEEP